MAIVAKTQFTTYNDSVRKALDLIRAETILPQNGLIILKPNLTTRSRPPVTTDIKIVEAVYRYIREKSAAEIAIGEGCGSGTTADLYDSLGYTDLAEKYGTRLIDFNEEEADEVTNSTARSLRTFYLPKIAREAFIVSIPVLKDHSFTRTTISLKNMFGIAPAPYYRGGLNKSALHRPSTDVSVADINLYKKPGLSIVDASVALTGSHLGGTPKKLGAILASSDPVAVDTLGSRLLGHNPKKLEYLRLSNNLHGSSTGFQVVKG
jgi:uncharacterized protein (DUF362 family)